MGSGASSDRRRVTFGDDEQEERYIDEHGNYVIETTTTQHTGGRPPTSGNTRTVERTYTDQDSFDMGDPRMRSESTDFGLNKNGGSAAMFNWKFSSWPKSIGKSESIY